jgi:signal transduction histidine kinase
VLRLPLVHQGAPVGTLITAARGQHDEFTPADLHLLQDLANQIGSAIHAVRLTSDLRALTRDLQHSREHLVTAREEERRRLRRDLHDGLGPMLSAIMLKVGALHSVYGHDPQTADRMLNQLESDIELVIGDVRRLVYNLRPPALDELGLLGAIREYLARIASGNQAQAGQIDVTLDVPETLPPLPAAVEVAAYRIVQEAVTNVVRHAHAHSCLVRVAAGDTLSVEVRDDGIGLAPDHPAGVGLASMRERAEELGGTLTISPVWPGGTQLTARLPLFPTLAA